jgi:hypothetical protein
LDKVAKGDMPLGMSLFALGSFDRIPVQRLSRVPSAMSPRKPPRLFDLFMFPAFSSPNSSTPNASPHNKLLPDDYKTRPHISAAPGSYLWKEKVAKT